MSGPRSEAPRSVAPVVPPLSISSSPPCHHRRRNSDDSRQILPSLFDAAEATYSLEQLLPRALLADIAPEPASLEKFDSILANQGVGDAHKYIAALVASQSDAREKGKILRTAAELAKRQAEDRLAVEFYAKATEVDGQTAASWVDRAKLLEGLGRFDESASVLELGILNVAHVDQLLRKLLRLFERTGEQDRGRPLLGRLRSAGPAVDQEVVITEGALFEMRQGNVAGSMELLMSIRGPGGWKPGLYCELIQYIERCGLVKEGGALIEEGVRLNYRTAAVCQTWLRSQTDPVKVVQLLRESSSKWTAEFTDKMTTTVCECLAQNKELGMSRLLMAETLIKSSPAQRHKLLLTAAMNELLFGDWSLPPLLIDSIMRIAPTKSKPMVVVLSAKICELQYEYERALGLLQHTVREYAAEWRVFLELAQFYLHRNDVDHAIRAVADGLRVHPGSGRLWAFRVQLEAFVGVDRQIEILRRAIGAVPKSGEVWCEAARIALNPLTPYFNLSSAKKYLEFAYRFTPQHGDSLVEMLRAEMLIRGLQSDLMEIRKRFLGSEGNYGLLFIFIRKLFERPLIEVFDDAVRQVQGDITRNWKVYARAIARSSFVLSSIPAEAEKLDQMKASESPARFAFGLTNIGEMILNPDLCKTREERLSVILGSSGIGIGQ